MLTHKMSRIKASAAGGGLSRFGERAARMLFRMADRVRRRRTKNVCIKIAIHPVAGRRILVFRSDLAITTRRRSASSIAVHPSCLEH